MAKSMLLICRQSPWSGSGAREALDIALAGGAFELPIALLFLDDGVFQLASGQRPAAIGQKDLGANLRALPMFGVDELYVDQRSLDARGLAGEALGLPVTRVGDEELRTLLDRFDLLVTL
jgi:tRNA 2-thiouridine synthesizing protein C